MNTAELTELAALKQGARQVWAAGDFAAVALRQLWQVGPRIVERAGVLPGEHVLDVACGTGNAAIPAARAGGRVVGVDLTPELFDAGRKLAAEAGVQIDWVEGDAEALPFDDESFDVVLSTFGVMFAPRHVLAARELARVLSPGGRIGLSNWTPEGVVGSFFRTVGSYLPPHSPLADPPLLWGSETHVEELFRGTGIELEFERRVAEPAPVRVARVRAGVHHGQVRPGDHGPPADRGLGPLGRTAQRAARPARAAGAGGVPRDLRSQGK